MDREHFVTIKINTKNRKQTLNPLLFHRDSNSIEDCYRHITEENSFSYFLFIFLFRPLKTCALCFVLTISNTYLTQPNQFQKEKQN